MNLKKQKIGDVYGCSVDGGIRCFQYVCDDSTQLDSHVIAVFRKNFSNFDEVMQADFSSLDVDFFAHVFINLGVKMKTWVKIFNTSVIRFDEVLFRSTNDYGKGVTESDDWWVWKIDEPMRNVGSLIGDARKSFIGVVLAPPNVFSRLNTGKYSYAYPIPAGDELYWE